MGPPALLAGAGAGREQGRRAPVDTASIMKTAVREGAVVPSFNVPYLPMVEPLVAALRDENSFGFIAVARLEWMKFESRSMEAVKEEYSRYAEPSHTRLHLDHIPVIDEDGNRVDYEVNISEALGLGYDSVMVDGSRLPLEENINATARVVKAAHAVQRPVEAELGAVVGHESGPMPPYEELFASKQGFTDLNEALEFVRRTGCDWLSVAIGNIHGAVAEGLRDKEKPAARLDLDHLSALAEATQVPLVLHGGSGIPVEYIREAVSRGISKVNIGTELRKAYVAGSQDGADPKAGREPVYQTARALIRDRLAMSGSAELFDTGKA
jgi:ketose-bisphosphate aldolase